jgi:large subunit ribosomal protein L15
MQLHQLKPIHKSKHRKRVGRGGKKGTYAGRGLKGQKSRAGRKPRPGFAGGDTPLIKRLPKQRGQRGKLKIRQGRKLSRLRVKPIILNLKDIEARFKGGEVVSPQSLLGKGLIDRIGKRIPRVKILGEGKLTKKIEFRGIRLSKSVQKTTGKTEKKKLIKKKAVSGKKIDKTIKQKTKTKEKPKRNRAINK